MDWQTKNTLLISAALPQGANGRRLLLRKLHQAESTVSKRTEELQGRKLAMEGRKQCVCLQGSCARIVPDSCLLPPSLACTSQILSAPTPFSEQHGKHGCLQCKAMVLTNRGGASGPFMCAVPT